MNGHIKKVAAIALVIAGTAAVANTAEDTEYTTEDFAMWEEYVVQFDAVLAVDAAYLAAVQERNIYTGEDEEKIAELDAAVARAYEAVAVAEYITHYGELDCKPQEIIDALAFKGPNPTAVQQCVKSASTACGAGRVCQIIVKKEYCNFTCQDAKGKCPDQPASMGER